MPAAALQTKPGRAAWLALLGLALNGLMLNDDALAQAPGGPPDVVSWTASVPANTTVKPGSRVKITLQGTVTDGWHVYGLDQPEAGPIPLLVTVDENGVAAADGAPTASTPTTFHDPSFNLDTQFYSKPFTVTAPVRIDPKAAAGVQQIPVSVRFQSCNGPTCRPPKTVHLTASINVRAGG
jgi:DsbC/DsbD-like thiol-disulfide interchange protein